MGAVEAQDCCAVVGEEEPGEGTLEESISVRKRISSTSVPKL